MECKKTKADRGFHDWGVHLLLNEAIYEFHQKYQPPEKLEGKPADFFDRTIRQVVESHLIYEREITSPELLIQELEMRETHRINQIMNSDLVTKECKCGKQLGVKK